MQVLPISMCPHVRASKCDRSNEYLTILVFCVRGLVNVLQKAPMLARASACNIIKSVAQSMIAYFLSSLVDTNAIPVSFLIGLERTRTLTILPKKNQGKSIVSLLDMNSGLVV